MFSFKMVNKLAIVLAVLAASAASSLETSSYVQTLEKKMANDFFKSLEGPGDFDFAPHNPVEIDSPLIWKITAKCNVTGIDGGLASANMSARMLKGSGAINGHDIGGGFQLTINNNDSFSITAGALAKVTITNDSEQTVHVSCGLSAPQTAESFNDVLQLIYALDSKYMKN